MPDSAASHTRPLQLHPVPEVRNKNTISPRSRFYIDLFFFATGELDKHSGGSGGNSSEAEEVEMDLNLEGLNDCNCCVCKSLMQDVGNKLMECDTCQNLYHQECHSPPVSNEEADDPRLVWNCSECSKTMVSCFSPFS